MPVVLQFLVIFAISSDSVSSSPPVDFRCDRLIIDPDKQTLSCKGNVLCRQGAFLLCCHKLQATSIHRHTNQQWSCTGDVRARWYDKTLYAGKATLFTNTNTVVLTRQPSLTNGNNFVETRQIRIDLNKHTLQVDAPHGTIQPQALTTMLKSSLEAQPLSYHVLPNRCPVPKRTLPHQPLP